MNTTTNSRPTAHAAMRGVCYRWVSGSARARDRCAFACGLGAGAAAKLGNYRSDHQCQRGRTRTDGACHQAIRLPVQTPVLPIRRPLVAARRTTRCLIRSAAASRTRAERGAVWLHRSELTTAHIAAPSRAHDHQDQNERTHRTTAVRRTLRRAADRHGDLSLRILCRRRAD